MGGADQTRRTGETRKHPAGAPEVRTGVEPAPDSGGRETPDRAASSTTPSKRIDFASIGSTVSVASSVNAGSLSVGTLSAARDVADDASASSVRNGAVTGEITNRIRQIAQPFASTTRYVSASR